ncbi:MAG TPA: sigma-70 family RNA polymerase sigma factor [Pedococcus sp.]
MSGAEGAAEVAGAPEGEGVERVVAIVRRVVGARVADHHLAEDLVQETLVRVLAASERVEPDMLEPYAIATARNVVASMRRDRDREARNKHRALDLSQPDDPHTHVLADEASAAIVQALARLGDRERESLLAHEVAGRDTRSLAEEAGSSAGAVAAQLHRTRARLRVEYLLALEGARPPSEECRPALLALSSGDRRRQRDPAVAQHVLGCGFCTRVAEPLLDRRQSRDDEVAVQIRGDADIVRARQAARELAARLDFPATELTVIATAVSEMARNIVRFTSGGQVVVELVRSPRAGIRIVVADAGPGIADIESALADGYSTYDGLGLGLPGARRLMDEFSISSDPDQGTTVVMTKWLGGRNG